MTQRDHVRPTVRVWAGLAATAVAITAIATATSGSAAAMHSSAAQTEDMAALAAIADQVGMHGGITSATAWSDLLDGGFAEQFREDQVTFGDLLYDTYYAEADIFAVTGLMSPTGVTALGVGVDLWTNPFSYDWEYGYTGPLWDIDVDGDDDYEYYTGIVNVAGSVGGVLLDSADQFVCNVAVDWSPPTGAYIVGFPTACLGANLPQIRMRACIPVHRS